MENRKPHRRTDFDAIVEGWGSDSVEDLTARVELLEEYRQKNTPLLPAELKTLKAMLARLYALGVDRLFTFQ